MRKIRVGTTHRTYLERRNFFDIPLKRYEFCKIWDVYQVANYLCWRATGRIDWRLNFTHSDALMGPFYRDIRLLHFMNSISTSAKPWVSTFETLLPRYWQVNERHIELLAGSACRKLIALSQCSHDLQVRTLQERFPRYLDAIRPKLMVLHPPQRPLIRAAAERMYSEDGALVLTLVGTELTRKGLLEVLDAVDEVVRRGGKVTLNLIGLVTPISYPYIVTKDDVRATRARIAGSGHVKHVLRLPNESVLDIMLGTDIGLLPSYHDSHGYSVLEFLASGSPVITTNIRALPEINTEATGWLIELPLDDRREVVMRTPAEQVEVRATLRQGLVRVFESVLDAPQVLPRKGAAALDFIRRNHDPERNARCLESLYDEILGG